MSKNSGNTTNDPSPMSPHQTGQVGSQQAGNTGTMSAQTGGPDTQTGQTRAGAGPDQKSQTQSHEPGQGHRSGVLRNGCSFLDPCVSDWAFCRGSAL